MFKPSRYQLEKLSVILQHACGDGEKIALTVAQMQRSTVVYASYGRYSSCLCITGRKLSDNETLRKVDKIRRYLDSLSKRNVSNV